MAVGNAGRRGVVVAVDGFDDAVGIFLPDDGIGELTVEGTNGNPNTFQLEELSELDQKYLRVMVPPKLAVDVKTQSKLIPHKEAFDITTIDETYKNMATVLITKKSQRPFTSRLKIEVFLIAEEVEDSNYILLNLTAGDFILPSVTKGAEVEFETRPVKTVIFKDVISDAMKGEDFAGYLVVVTTLQDEIVLMDSNISKWLKDPEVIENLRELAIRGAPSPRSRHFDQTGKKVPPPRPAHKGATSR